MYPFLRSILFCLPAEFSHVLGLRALRLLCRLGLIRLVSVPVESTPVQLAGIRFPNPVGLAAGLDKNGDYIDALGSLGFGFIEVGTITPRPQPGNPKPRLFRLRRERAIINRMGFNNKGVDYLVERLRQRQWQGVLGVNIGKNKDTPVEQAADDYLACMKAVYPHADYIVVNLSSPNTPGLRSLQFGEHFDALLKSLRAGQLALNEQYGRYVPMFIKVAPDITEAEITAIAETLTRHGMDGVSATNTTISRDGVQGAPHATEAGGLSGEPLTARSRDVVRSLREKLGPDYPIIGIGGIHDSDSASARHRAGADLLQIYTGFIYSGPSLIGEACAGFREAAGR